MIAKTALRNLLVVGGFLALGTLYLSHEGFSRPFGYVGRAKQTGCNCHGDSLANENTTVTISTTATSFEPGKTYQFTVTVANPSRLSAGIDIAKRLSGSRLDTIEGDGLHKLSSELTHHTPKVLVNGKTSWNFLYTAPANSGFDTIYAVGNAVNGNNTTDAGDEWNFAQTFPVTIVQSSISSRSEITETFRLAPNPARRVTKLYFEMKKPADLRVAVLDATGREVVLEQRQDFAPGRGEITLDLSHLSAGDYLVNVFSNSSLLYTGKLSRLK